VFVVVAGGDVSDPICCCCENPEEGYSNTTADEITIIATESFIFVLSTLAAQFEVLSPLSAAGPKHDLTSLRAPRQWRRAHDRRAEL
jgi:hypothetical protein